jgi:hypothetical protein
VVPGLLFWLLLPTNKELCTVLALHSPVAKILQNPVAKVTLFNKLQTADNQLISTTPWRPQIRHSHTSLLLPSPSSLPPLYFLQPYMPHKVIEHPIVAV